MDPAYIAIILKSNGNEKPHPPDIINSKKHLIVANYGDNSPNPTSGLTVFPIQSNHHLSPYQQRIAYSSTPTISHAHGLAKKTLYGVEYVFATDLGTNTVYVYTFDSTRKEPLQLFTSAHGALGQGPRHVVVSKDGKYLYVANEFDPAEPITSTVSIYRFDPCHQSLTYLKSIPSERPSTVQNYPSELAIHNGYLYVSNRGGNNIAQFKITDYGKDLHFIDQLKEPLPKGRGILLTT